MTSMRIREEVFQAEQGIEKKMMSDAHDKEAYHCIIYDFGMPVGSGRLYEDENGFHIGRVAVMKEYRGKGLGRDIMEGLMAKAWGLGALKISVHAQEGVIPFYEKLGFTGMGDIFIEADIPHLEMEILKK